MSSKRLNGFALGSGLLGLVSVGFLTGFAPHSMPTTTPDAEVVPVPEVAQAQSYFDVASTHELSKLFDSQGFAWPPRNKIVPPVVLQSLPADFARLRNPELRKALFLRTMVPLVLLENRRIEEQRTQIEALFAVPATSWSVEEKDFISEVAREYGVSGKLAESNIQQALLGRIDQIPVALVIGQAVLESGWGGASKMIQRNSLFGMKRQGYKNLQDSVSAYMLNLNTNGAYAKLRTIRINLRAKGESLDPVKLAQGLSKYSTRGQRYVRDVLSTIRKHELSQLSELQLRS